jgi:5,10-methylenetetrahydromethanopterin reductase
MSDARPPVGVILGSALTPEQIPRAGELAEELGFAAAWISEDYFFTGGIASAATVLARTTQIDVGLGIVSALSRHPALLAMEISTLARMHPGRVIPAVGLGLPRWMAQMGLTPESSLAAVRAAVTNLRLLLSGQEVTTSDGPFSYDQIKLTHPLPDAHPPVWMGVSGPAMLRLAGEIADGVVISVMAGVHYIRWARERLAEGATRTGRDADAIAMNVFAFMSVDEDPARAKAAARHSLAYYLSGRPDGPVPGAYGITEELQRLAADGADAVEQRMPEQWVDDLAVAGDPDECAAKIKRLLDAGADQVSLYACPVERAADVIHMTGTKVLPLL